MYILKGKSQDYELVIGCEIHAQVATNSKLFSRSPVKFGSLQNENVSLFDASLPGVLPVINEFTVHQAIKTGLGLNGQINKESSYFGNPVETCRKF